MFTRLLHIGSASLRFYTPSLGAVVLAISHQVHGVVARADSGSRRSDDLRSRYVRWEFG